MDDVTEQLAALRVIPVVRVESVDEAKTLADALLAGGLPCAEITLRTTAGLEAIAHLSANRPELLVGAGTVLDPEQARAARDAGARFMVSPGIDEDILAICREARLPIFPGVATPTDLMRARRAGIEIAKLFPAEALGGLSTLKALTGPFPSMRFIPTGGIHAGNAPAYLEHPSVFAVGGSWMVPGDAVRARDAATLTALAREATAIRPNG